MVTMMERRENAGTRGVGGDRYISLSLYIPVDMERVVEHILHVDLRLLTPSHAHAHP